MEVTEIRDLTEARRFVLQGLWLQRAMRPAAPTVKPALEWTLEIAASGQPLPPVGFVTDVGAIAFGLDVGKSTEPMPEVPGWPAGMARRYEDQVLGKICADWTFERASDALRGYAGRDRVRGLAYVVRQMRERGGIGGVELSPAVIRGLAALSADECLNQGYESLNRDGPSPALVRHYEAIMSAARRMSECLGVEDVAAVEQRMALADMGQYVAHRQIVQTTALFDSQLPTRPVGPLAGRKEVPTRVSDEDQYPVGGYSSISNRGSIESLLHSQLAFMEPTERPDLFDVKFVRDELFFYSRDENQFLRRRRHYVFVFDPSLTSSRMKDVELPCQRIVLAMATVLILIRRLTDWLSADAMVFDLVFPRGKTNRPLADEATLLEILLREWVAVGTAVFRFPTATEQQSGKHIALDPATLTTSTAIAEADLHGRQAQVQVLVIGQAPEMQKTAAAVVTRLAVNGPSPALFDGHGDMVVLSSTDPLLQWIETVRRILELWV